MRWGRQEDAHEFLRYLMDALHKSCMSGHQRTDSPNESMIQRIFSGELRSQGNGLISLDRIYNFSFNWSKINFFLFCKIPLLLLIGRLMPFFSSYL